MAFAFIFDTVSGGEWLVLLAVILIVVGPKNLPSAARKTGEILAKLRRAADEFKRQLMTMDQEVSRTVNDVAGELKQDYVDVPSDDLAGEGQSPSETQEGSGDATGSDYPDYSDYSDYPENPDFPETSAPAETPEAATSTPEENEVPPAAQ